MYTHMRGAIKLPYVGQTFNKNTATNWHLTNFGRSKFTNILSLPGHMDRHGKVLIVVSSRFKIGQLEEKHEKMQKCEKKSFKNGQKCSKMIKK